MNSPTVADAIGSAGLNALCGSPPSMTAGTNCGSHVFTASGCRRDALFREPIDAAPVPAVVVAEQQGDLGPRENGICVPDRLAEAVVLNHAWIVPSEPP